MAIDWARLKSQIIEAGVMAINGQLNEGLIKAERDVPVRKIFAGGRQTVRFKTASEVQQDRALRSSLGLAPEILATAEAQAFVRSRGRNPLSSNFSLGVPRQGPVMPRSSADRGARLPTTEAGFARTISHPARGSYRDATGLTRAERGYTRNSANRANASTISGSPGGGAETGGMEQRRVRQSGTGFSLANEEAEYGLTARGRYELRTGRAISRDRVGSSSTFDLSTGKITVTHGTVGPARLGGGLRSTLRIDEAYAGQYPELQGWLLAGDQDHDYAKYQELGTRHNPAHPFLRPRLPEWRQGLPRGLRRALGRTPGR